MSGLAILATYMSCIGEAGAQYGLKFNWAKILAMPVRMEARIRKDDGNFVECRTSMKYLGGMLSADGRIGSELARRLGTARAEYEALRRIWSHSSLSVARKISIFNACVLSKLEYGLFTANLFNAELRRINGFQARCLRGILGVAPAYHSRVSNATVLNRAQQTPLGDKISARKVQYMTELSCRDVEDPFRRLIFHQDGSIREVLGPRGVGRPQTRWHTQTMSLVA